MFGSIRIATVRGIPIKVHFTLLAIFGLLAAQLGLFGLPVGVLLFTSVALHELGHSVVAQRYGIPIREISLHLLGGTALMEAQPKRPKEEILIALAGPAVSFALAAASGVLAAVLGAHLMGTALVDLLAYGAALNLVMGAFNLIPALPMDGGRVFRAALQSRLGPFRATQWAVRVSRVFAAIFVMVGLYQGMVTLTLIGAMLFFMTARELRVATAQEALRRAWQPPPEWAPQWVAYVRNQRSSFDGVDRP